MLFNLRGLSIFYKTILTSRKKCAVPCLFMISALAVLNIHTLSLIVLKIFLDRIYYRSLLFQNMKYYLVLLMVQLSL